MKKKTRATVPIQVRITRKLADQFKRLCWRRDTNMRREIERMIRELVEEADS